MPRLYVKDIQWLSLEYLLEGQMGLSELTPGVELIVDAIFALSLYSASAASTCTPVWNTPMGLLKKMVNSSGAWVAKSVEHWTLISAQVLILGSRD